MTEEAFALLALLVAFGMVWGVHSVLARHFPAHDRSDKAIILWLESVVLICLFGAFLKGEIHQLIRQQEGNIREDALLLLATLAASLLIYRVFTWGKG